MFYEKLVSFCRVHNNFIIYPRISITYWPMSYHNLFNLFNLIWKVMAILVFCFQLGLFHFYYFLSLILSIFLDYHKIPSRVFFSKHSKLRFVAHIRQLTVF